MRIALISEHASPLAALGGVDAGGQNRHVAELAAALGRHGHAVTVYTRQTEPDAPTRVRVEGYDVVHVPAGPAVALEKDVLLPYMDQFGRWLAQRWRTAEPAPDVIHAHFWMSGVAAMRAAGRHIPVVLTYHALGSVKRRYQAESDTSPAERLMIEARLGRQVSRVIAQCEDEAAELARMGVPASRVEIIPSGVDIDRFRPEGPRAGDGGGGEDGRLHLRAVPRGGAAARRA